MDLLCCHKGRAGQWTAGSRRKRDGEKLVLTQRPRSPHTKQPSKESIEEVEEPEAEEDFVVTLRIVKADLPNNGNLVGAANLYVTARWEGDTSNCEWQVSSTPTQWLDAVAPEWDHAFPAQPRAAFLKGEGASIVFEVFQEPVMFGSATVIGEAQVSAENLLEGLGKGDMAERDFVLWQEDEDAGTIIVQVLVETMVAPERVAQLHHKLMAASKVVQLQRGKHLAPPRKSVSVPRIQMPEEESSSGSDGEPSQEEDEQPTPRRAAGDPPRSFRGRQSRWTGMAPPTSINRMMAEGPALIGRASMMWKGNGAQASGRNKGCQPPSSPRHAEPLSRNSSTSSTSSSREGDEKTPAHKFANAMQNHWNQVKLQAGSQEPVRFRSQRVDNKPWEVDQVNTAGSEALKILESVKAARKADRRMQKVPGQPRDEAAEVKALLKRVKVTAKKLPRTGFGLLTIPKERFFAITKDKQKKADSHDLIGSRLSLSWFEDEASFQQHCKPLGSIPITSICRSSVDEDQQAVGYVVTIECLPNKDDPDTDPEPLTVIFGTLLAAEEWNTDLNDLLELTCRH